MFLFSSASRVESLALTCKCAQGRNECRDDRPRHPLHRRDVGGVQNALAGGGSFITLPSLMLSGMDARAANITSTVALFPAQLVTGFTGRADAGTPTGLTTRRLFVISLVGGALGALILLAMPPSIFVFFRRRALAAGARHRSRCLIRRLGRRVDAETRQRAALEARRRRLGLALTIGLFWTAP
jgi:uncharacterized membrane protein YfcA